MSHLVVNANTFAAEAVAGYVAANPRYVRQVDGGVVRSTVIPDKQVALVIGGGSGHYPGYTGFVGPGLGSGAVCGNIFASPSSGQVYRVARAVERGAGVLMAIGNYAGDILHFGVAAERLRAEGIDVRMLAMTDDVASAPPNQIENRRGIAGCLAVVKVAGAAAEAGMSLDEVERIAQKANDRTRTLGVAFSGCTLPGASAPLFSVPAGQMAFGLGIHGEPGVAEFPLMDASSLADLLVGKLLEDLPPPVGAQRAVVILNGLGSFKYEELFALFGAVHSRLTQANVEVADSECGEFITSLDMAGVSLTLSWVDDELEALWNAPADSPGFRRGLVVERVQQDNSTPHMTGLHDAGPTQAQVPLRPREGPVSLRTEGEGHPARTEKGPQLKPTSHEAGLPVVEAAQDQVPLRPREGRVSLRTEGEGNPARTEKGPQLKPTSHEAGLPVVEAAQDQVPLRPREGPVSLRTEGEGNPARTEKGPQLKPTSHEAGLPVVEAAQDQVLTGLREGHSAHKETSPYLTILKGLRRAHAALMASEAELGRLDSVAGDGDHGQCMTRGAAGALKAAERVAAEGGSISQLLKDAAEAWADQGGGASGALWGAALSAAGESLTEEPDSAAVSRAVAAALAAVRRLGGAEVGDKTMVDAFAPFAEEVSRSISAGMDLAEAWQAAAHRATEAAAKTADLIPRLGRARTHGERSLGHPDPGAISFALVVDAVGSGRV